MTHRHRWVQVRSLPEEEFFRIPADIASDALICEGCHKPQKMTITERDLPRSNAEESLATLIRWEKLPEPAREYRFHLTRKWRFDFAWPAQDKPLGEENGIRMFVHRPAIALEVEGGSFVTGRHTRGSSFEADCEKYNEAALLGWTVLRVTPRMIEDGRAIALLKRALL